jgi:glyoxylase-like metal-dependent hydrolase (beta-lactamase superfamily II)
VAEYKVISIGAMAAHPLWDEKGEVRPAHATTTLVTAGDRLILVDPSLPPQILIPRLAERAGIGPERITDVFLTNFNPMRRRGIAAFDEARWWIAEGERGVMDASLRERLEEADEVDDEEVARLVRVEQALLERCRDCPDSLAEGVDLFPLPGVTEGNAGLLLPQRRDTVLICGDAVPTVEHLAAGRLMSPCADVERARESFREAIEIADILVLGRDNAVSNPMRGPFGMGPGGE